MSMRSLTGPKGGYPFTLNPMATTTPTEMTVERTNLNPATVELTVTCSEEQVNSGFERALRELSKRVRVPGFRPGKAPKHLVEEAINPQALYEQAADYIVKNAFEKALTKEDLKPAGQPSVNITEFFRGGEELKEGGIATPTFNFTIKVPLEPVVELADIEGLTAQRPPVEVTDEEIEYQIDELRRGQGKKSEVTNRGIQEGDAVVLTLTSDSDSSDSRTFMVIAGQTFPGLDEAIQGMSADEVKLQELDFPETFQHEAWKGQSLKVKILIKSVSAFQLPELDNEFAKTLNIDDIETLRERVREGIHNIKQNMVRDMLRDQLLDNLIAKSELHVADNTWEGVVDRKLRDLGEELGARKTTFEDYLKSQNLTEEEFMNSLREEAQVNVKRAVVIQKLFQTHEMKLENSDFDHYFRQILAENNIPADQVEGFAKKFGAQIRDEIQFRAMAGKVADLLIEKANIEEVTPGGAESKPKAKAKAAGETSKAKSTKKKEEK